MEIKLFLTELQLLNLAILWSVLHYMVLSLCNPFLPQISMDLFKTLHTFCGSKKMCRCSFDGDYDNCDSITAFKFSTFGNLFTVWSMEE